MKLEILEKKEDPLFNREFIKVVSPNEGSSPSRSSIRKELVNKLKVKPELVQVHKIKTNYGGGSFSADVVIYKDEKSVSVLESKKYKKKNQVTKEKKDEDKKEVAEKSSSEESSSDGDQ